MKKPTCKLCGNTLIDILPLGRIPLVNYYPKQSELATEKKYTLTFSLCTHCSLCQLKQSIQPKKIFSTYHYTSSTSLPLQQHLEKLAEVCRKKFKLSKKNMVLDIGCNDGILLAKLKQHDISILGVDPAQNIGQQTQKNGIPVVIDFFTSKLARKLKKQKKSFDLIVSTNTLAQSINPRDFIDGINYILKKDGILVLEVGYVLDMIQKKTFDSIYHEHYSYFSLASLAFLLKEYNIKIFDVQHIANHGGSLRVFATSMENTKRKVSKRFKTLLAKENKYQLDNPKSYEIFVTYVKQYKRTFRNILLTLKKQNKHIAGVGSPAKSVVLLNYCEITPQDVDFIVDSTPYKQQKYMPGTHIPIFPENKLQTDTPDYFLLLAWTYKDVLLKKLAVYKKKKVILPFPKLKIISL